MGTDHIAGSCNHRCVCVAVRQVKRACLIGIEVDQPQDIVVGIIQNRKPYEGPYFTSSAWNLGSWRIGSQRGSRRRVFTLVLQLGVQAPQLLELAAQRRAKTAVRDGAERASDAKQDKSNELEHRVALPRVELRNRQSQDDGRSACRDRQPPVAVGNTRHQCEQAAGSAKRHGPTQAPSGVQGGTSQDQRRGRRRKARPEHESRAS